MLCGPLRQPADRAAVLAVYEPLAAQFDAPSLRMPFCLLTVFAMSTHCVVCCSASCVVPAAWPLLPHSLLATMPAAATLLLVLSPALAAALAAAGAAVAPQVRTSRLVQAQTQLGQLAGLQTCDLLAVLRGAVSTSDGPYTAPDASWIERLCRVAVARVSVAEAETTVAAVLSFIDALAPGTGSAVAAALSVALQHPLTRRVASAVAAVRAQQSQQRTHTSVFIPPAPDALVPWFAAHFVDTLSRAGDVGVSVSVSVCCATGAVCRCSVTPRV